MDGNDPKIAELEARLENLVRSQIGFQAEVTAIRNELTRLRSASRVSGAPESARPIPPPTPVTKVPALDEKWSTAHRDAKVPPPPNNQYARPPSFGSTYQQKTESSRTEFGDRVSDYVTSRTKDARGNLEKFIGENLISKIGIIVLILGVGIGAKYAIDNNLISPATRIILGYVFGFGLLAVALRLKPKYRSFSAVLLSGGMAILYFITYFAYAIYELVPQSAAFPLMVIFTEATVAAAISYNLQIIAHIGLVGAYAVPFLLSTGSSNFAALFGYMGVINLGVLALSVKKYWKPLFYTASAFTWLIFFAWFATRYTPGEYLYLALGFLALFFGIFYAAKVVHGVQHAESKDNENIAAIIGTAVVFFAFCLGISDFAGTPSQYAVVFGYLAVISLAILITSYRFYGRILVFVTYPFVWLIYANWFFERYSQADHFTLAVFFASVFFAVFYGTTLVYRLISDEADLPVTAGMMLTNSFIFYGFGYGILNSRENLHAYQGLFTVAHSAFHSIVAQLVSRLRPAATDVVQVLAVLIVTFATIAVPVQFDGNFVTMIWSVEAVVLFYFGRSRGVRFFEYFAYPVMSLAAGSMAVDWLSAYGDRWTRTPEFAVRPFTDGNFITGLVFVAAFAAIYFINRDEKIEPAIDSSAVKPLGYLIGAVALVSLYNVFRMEIGNFFFYLSFSTGPNRELSYLNVVTQIDYSMLFLVILGVINLNRIRSAALGITTIALSFLVLLVYITAGLYILYELRVTYLAGESLTIFGIPAVGLWMRPTTYILTGGLLTVLFAYSRGDLLDRIATKAVRFICLEAVVYPVALITASCELMNLAAHFGIANAGKFGLSILWGVFALLMVVIGIARGRQHLRIAAIVLLAVTLVKLFFYDITDLGTIQKTLLFVALGILLLVISFLYNKYKAIIFGSETISEE